MVAADTHVSSSRRRLASLQHAVSDRLGGAACFAAALLFLALFLLRSCTQPAYSQLKPCKSPAGSANTPPPAVLAKMLVMVTFYWDINHLAFLTQVRTPTEYDVSTCDPPANNAVA